MSAQAGIWNFGEKPVDRRSLAELGKLLMPYGPDGESVYSESSIGILYRPFHTTPESLREKQPFTTRKKRLILTWDGRLDNREELIKDLASGLSTESTDVEIVASAYEEWESDAFRRLIGDWAVVIWKPGERELVFAVDYLSIRHIFYSIKNDQIIWSTDVAPIVLASGDHFRIEDDYISGYFAHDPDAWLTPYRGIVQVAPGRWVRVHNGTAVDHRHSRATSHSRIWYRRDSEYEDHFREVFRRAVKRRLRANGRILAELSGGIDSSSIVCMADDILANEGAPTMGLDTISYYDESEPEGDDWLYFPKVEEKRGRIGHHIDVATCQTSTSPFRDTAFHGLPGKLGSRREIDLQRARIIQDGSYRAVLRGIGGDEFFGGIPDPRSQLADLLVSLRVVELLKQAWAWSLAKRKPLIALLWQSAMVLLPSSVRRILGNTPKVEAWIDKEFVRRTNLANRLMGPREKFGFCLPSRRSYLSGLSLMANTIAKQNNAALALEEHRYPYLDQDLIAFILAIPKDQLLRPGERRSLVRRALADVVPAEILGRRTKQVGIRTPILTLERNSEELRNAFACPLTAQLGYVNRDDFLKAVDDARHGKSVNLVRLRKAIALEFWLQNLNSRGLLQCLPSIDSLAILTKGGTSYEVQQTGTHGSR